MYGDEGSVNRNYSSETFHSPHPQLNQQQQQQQQRSGGLTRFHSAPSSFFQTLIDDLDITTNSQRFLVPGSDEILSSSTRQQHPPLQSFIYQDQNQNQNQSHVLKHEMEPFDISSTNCNNGFASSRSSSGGLLRQSSSPADFFSSLFDDNDAIGVGFATCTGNSQASHQTTHMPMPSIPEFQQHHSVSGSLGSLFEKADSYADCWQGNNAAMAGKRSYGDLRNETTFSVSNELWHQHQNGYASNASNSLIHQMSLPNTSSERAAMDKYLQFQESSTPCSGTRAKRGFATHPRSIAERVRRTKISQRMRKLQQLFPDIDKQTNTAQMLDMATDYIKGLEKEVQSLTDTRGKCKCLKTQ